MKAEEAKKLTDITNHNFEQYLINFEQDKEKYLKSIFSKIGEKVQKGDYCLNFNFLHELGISFASRVSPDNEHKFICHMLQILKSEYNYSISIDKIPGWHLYQISWNQNT